MDNVISTTGKRKRAVARATVKKGTGKIKINKIPLEQFQPEFLRLKIMEPIILSGDASAAIDADVTTSGGGVSGQAEAARQAIAKGIVEITKNAELKNRFLKYDRNLLVYDPRRTEPHKQSRSTQGPRRERQSSKR